MPPSDDGSTSPKPQGSPVQQPAATTPTRPPAEKTPLEDSKPKSKTKLKPKGESKPKGEEEEKEEPSTTASTFRLKFLKVNIAGPPAEDSADGDEAPKEGTKPTPVTTVEYKKITLEAFKATTLTDVRSKISSVVNETFRFSDTDGTIAQDHTTFADYFQNLTVDIKPDEQLKVYITPFKRGKMSAAELLKNPPFLLKFAQKLKDDGLQKEGTLHSSSVPGLETGRLRMSEVRKYVKAMSANTKGHQFCLEDGHVVDDSMTLKEYVGSLSKPVEEEEQSQGTPSIEVYFCKPGIQRKSKSKGASDEIKNHAALKPDEPGFKGTEAIKVERDKALLEIKEELDAAKYAITGGDDAKSAGSLTEDEWQSVIRNCNLMFGWVVDINNNKVIRAPKAAFQLRKGLNMGTPPASASEVAKTDTEASEEPKATVEKAEKAQAIPNFAVDDDARIEITLTSHQFQESMAKAHFSATSVEASVSGGFGSFSGGVSGGYSNESSSNDSSSRKENEKTMIGTYRFPRATVHLTPGDLEPTEDLKAAINKIRTSKNVAHLRRLHKEFGHLFCHKVVIGGCMQTTKTITMKETSEEHSTKEQFKASVGVAVQTPWVSASVKTSHEQGSSQQQGTQTVDTKEKMVFEATGGNTILVSDPIRWTASLSDYKNWRVIQQDQPTSLAETISQIPGYSNTQMLFAQAIPLLSRFLEIPQSRTFNVRMKAVLDQPGIARILGNTAHKYFGHDSKALPDPIHVGLKARPGALESDYGRGYVEKGRVVMDMTIFTTQESFPGKSLFSPKSTQAPVLLPYGGKLTLEKTAQKDEFVSAYQQTVWRFEVPDGEVLAHEARVSIRSLASSPNPTLSVYRNQQGVYLPAMSGSDGPSFWRVLKSDPTSRVGDPIRDGDNIRLSWRFSDQTDGFRDFYDDTFGRRRFTKPDDASDVLYLKVPYPSFQSSDSTLLVMSAAETINPIVESLRVLPLAGFTESESQANYNLHDITFRLDSAGADGLGESKDYMAPAVDDKGAFGDVWAQDKVELKVPALIVASILLTGSTSPIAGPLLRAILL